MADEPAKLLREIFEMVPSLRQKDGRAAFLQRMENVVQDEAVAHLALGKRRVDARNGGVGRATVQAGGLADNVPVAARPPCRVAPGIYGETNAPELHLQEGMVRISAVRSGGHAQDLTGADLREHALYG